MGCFYRPQGKVMFSEVSVSHSVLRGEEVYPLDRDPRQTETPLDRDPHPPPHCSSQYTSSWNVFLLHGLFSHRVFSHGVFWHGVLLHGCFHMGCFHMGCFCMGCFGVGCFHLGCFCIECVTSSRQRNLSLNHNFLTKLCFTT